MTSKDLSTNYLYSFKYDYHHSNLCKLESRQLFNQEEYNNSLISNLKIDPSISPFIKKRIEIISSSQRYADLLISIKKANIRMNGFKVEYLIMKEDTAGFEERKEKLRGIGHCIEGEPDFDTPSIIYAIAYDKNVWYFGILVQHHIGWLQHKKKPHSFSNSISMNIAKTLVSLASRGHRKTQLLDACCGVGTIMLEACFLGLTIDGCDINWKACHHTRENLSHYHYTAHVHCSDIKDLNQKYDAAIVDLPYNLYSYSDDTITSNIISSTAKLALRVVIVSITDIREVIKASGLKVIDFCTVEKRGKSKFARSIWVCEK